MARIVDTDGTKYSLHTIRTYEQITTETRQHRVGMVDANSPFSYFKREGNNNYVFYVDDGKAVKLSTRDIALDKKYTYIGNNRRLISPDNQLHIVRIQDIRVLLDIKLYRLHAANLLQHAVNGTHHIQVVNWSDGSQMTKVARLQTSANYYQTTF